MEFRMSPHRMRILKIRVVETGFRRFLVVKSHLLVTIQKNDCYSEYSIERRKGVTGFRHDF